MRENISIRVEGEQKGETKRTKRTKQHVPKREEREESLLMLFSFCNLELKCMPSRPEKLQQLQHSLSIHVDERRDGTVSQHVAGLIAADALVLLSSCPLSLIQFFAALLSLLNLCPACCLVLFNDSLHLLPLPEFGAPPRCCPSQQNHLFPSSILTTGPLSR